MNKLIAILLITFSLFGCCTQSQTPASIHHVSSAAPYQRGLITDVYIDEDFPAQERFEIEASLEQMNYALNGYRVFRVVDDHKHILSTNPVGPYDLVFVHLMGDDDSPLAMVDDIPGHIVFWYESKMAHIGDRVVVLMHEESHILGGYHQPDHEGALLYPYYVKQAYGGHCVDQYTAAEIVRANHYMKLENLNYCVIK